MKSSKKQGWNKVISNILMYCVIGIIGCILGLVISKGILSPAVVVGDSMYPTFRDGEKLLASRVILDIHRGDILCVEHEDEILLKRVIGLPGDTIQIKDSKVYINGFQYNETYISSDLQYSSGIAEEPITLRDEEYFVLGDNRDISKDSRVIGTIFYNQIKGKVITSR